MFRKVQLLGRPQTFEFFNLEPTAPIETLNKERGVRSVTIDWVLDNLPHTSLIRRATEDIHDVLRSVEAERGCRAVIDARVQRLMPDMFPSIPGWHMDSVERDDFYGQPDVTKISDHISTFVCTMSSHPEGVSNTKFLADPLTVYVDEAKPIYKQIHEIAESKETWSLPDGHWAFMSHGHVHKASPTVRRGYRMFYRATVLPHVKPKNRGYTDVEQVYVLTEGGGW